MKWKENTLEKPQIKEATFSIDIGNYSSYILKIHKKILILQQCIYDTVMKRPISIYNPMFCLKFYFITY